MSLKKRRKYSLLIHYSDTDLGHRFNKTFCLEQHELLDMLILLFFIFKSSYLTFYVL